MFYRSLVSQPPVKKDREIFDVVSETKGNVVVYRKVLNSEIQLPDRSLFTLKNQLKSGIDMPHLNPTQLSAYDSTIDAAASSISDAQDIADYEASSIAEGVSDDKETKE